MMIIWINGPYGIGKTTISNELNKKIMNSFIYDPEMTGEFIWHNSPDCISRKGDFQDIPLWRDFNYKMLKYLHENYSGIIIVPMTLVNKEYYNEIVDRLNADGVPVHHYILEGSKSIILKRLLRRGEVDNSWASQQIDRCLISFDKDIKGIKVDTNNLSIEEVVEFILENSYGHMNSYDELKVE